MSDALTDIARDQRRGRYINDFYNALTDYLESGDKGTACQRVIRAAKDADMVPSGYWGGKSNLHKGISKSLKKLRQGDKKEWSRILLPFMTNRLNMRSSIFERLKKLSPFKDKLLVHVFYGVGFCSLKGEIEFFFNDIIEEKFKKGSTYNCQEYFVALSKEKINKETEIVKLENRW